MCVGVDVPVGVDVECECERVCGWVWVCGSGGDVDYRYHSLSRVVDGCRGEVSVLHMNRESGTTTDVPSCQNHRHTDTHKYI